VAITFGLDGQAWQPDLVLQRYELLYESGLVPESPAEWRRPASELAPGDRMLGDHRRVLATGLARLRAKIGYRPVVFELLSPTFTLRQLQDCVEALAGRAVHTQNFRRLIEQQALVEETGEVDGDTGGRPPVATASAARCCRSAASPARSCRPPAPAEPSPADPASTRASCALAADVGAQLAARGIEERWVRPTDREYPPGGFCSDVA